MLSSQVKVDEAGVIWALGSVVRTDMRMGQRLWLIWSSKPPRPNETQFVPIGVASRWQSWLSSRINLPKLSFRVRFRSYFLLLSLLKSTATRTGPSGAFESGCPTLIGYEPMGTGLMPLVAWRASPPTKPTRHSRLIVSAQI